MFGCKLCFNVEVAVFWFVKADFQSWFWFVVLRIRIVPVCWTGVEKLFVLGNVVNAVTGEPLTVEGARCRCRVARSRIDSCFGSSCSGTGFSFVPHPSTLAIPLYSLRRTTDGSFRTANMRRCYLRPRAFPLFFLRWFVFDKALWKRFNVATAEVIRQKAWPGRLPATFQFHW